MNDLKAIAVDLGFANVRSYIASGNLLFASDVAEAKVKAMLEDVLDKHMKAPVPVIIRTAGELDRIVRDNPFADQPGNRVAAIFLDRRPPPDVVESARNRADDERIALGQREVYVAYGELGMGRSRLQIPAAKAGTARNMNTVAKLAELAMEMS